jgi:hypothetical protein
MTCEEEEEEPEWIGNPNLNQMSGTYRSSDQETTRPQPSMLQLGGKKKAWLWKETHQAIKASSVISCTSWQEVAESLLSFRRLSCKLDGCKKNPSRIPHKTRRREEDIPKEIACVCVLLKKPLEPKWGNKRILSLYFSTDKKERTKLLLLN